MLEAGKRTLIVSHSNVAVDNAILRIGRKFPDAVDRQPGAVLRWGFVRLKELQDDDASTPSGYSANVIRTSTGRSGAGGTKPGVSAVW